MKYTWINSKANLTAFQTALQGPQEPTLCFCPFPAGSRLWLAPSKCLLYGLCFVMVIKWLQCKKKKNLSDFIFRSFHHTVYCSAIPSQLWVFLGPCSIFFFCSNFLSPFVCKFVLNIIILLGTPNWIPLYIFTSFLSDNFPKYYFTFWFPSFSGSKYMEYYDTKISLLSMFVMCQFSKKCFNDVVTESYSILRFNSYRQN